MKRRVLNKHEGLKQALTQMTEDESIVMSDRALTFRDQIHVLDSHKVHGALQGSTTKDQHAISSELVPNSDKIMYVVKETKKLHLLFKRDAGRRNCCPVGIEQLRDCISANFVSKDLMLLEMRTRRY